MTMTSSTIKLPTARFTVMRAIQGWEVVDRDGRPVEECLTSESEAYKLAEYFNMAAYGGLESLSRALGAS
jgi:hypothetical protein